MKKELAQKLNAYLANVATMYAKVHNLHWNVYGPAFKPTHEYLESLYDEFGEELDTVAEILKQNGEYPLASLKDYASHATIKEIESKDYSIDESLKIVLGDFEILKAQVEDIREEAEEEFIVANHAEDILEGYAKTIWFIKAMLK